MFSKQHCRHVLQLCLSLLVCLVGADSGASIAWEPFLWGTATAAYQVEGAAKIDNRGPSIWDTFSATAGKVHNGDTGDIAADSYHQFPRDIELMRNLGVNSYRLSLSWSRILPLGVGEVNPLGVDYYNALLDALVANAIQPVVTLYHWDLPQALQERYNGLLGEEFEQDFVNYAKICFDLFGDKVRKWVTFNEPWSIAYGGFGSGVFAPGRCSNRSRCAEGNSSTEPYLVAHNILNAHAKVAELYRAEYRHPPARPGDALWQSTHGQLGIVLNLDWAEAFHAEDPTHQQAAARRRDFQLGWFLDPLLHGDYPPSLLERVSDRLPAFSAEQRKRLLDNPLDFLGLNHYSTRYYLPRTEAAPTATDAVDGWLFDQDTRESREDRHGVLIGPQAASPWLNTVPWGLYNATLYVHSKCLASGASDGLVLYITENGCDAPGEATRPLPQVLEDSFRVDYLREYLAALDRAIRDGANVKGYFVWSLLDNFEWADGYSMRFGLHYVDYSDSNRTRYPKQSARWYGDYIAQHRHSYTGRAVLIPPIMGPPIGADHSPQDDKYNSNWFIAVVAFKMAADVGLPVLFGI